MTAGREGAAAGGYRIHVEGPLDRAGAERLLLELRRAVRSVGLRVRARVEREVEPCDESPPSCC